MIVGINQELSPIKFCFFIKPEVESLNRACQVANSFWGGRNSPIFPLYEKFDRRFRMIFSANESEEKFYQNLLKNFNPDIIVLEDGLNSDFASKVIGDRIIISLSVLEESLLKLENEYGLTIFEILYEIVTAMFEYKRNDDLQILLAKNDKNEPLISILFNTPINELSSIIHDSLKERDFYKTAHVGLKDLHLFREANAFTYTKINFYKLSKQRSFGDYYEFVFIFNPADIYSLIVLWNLKAAGRFVFALPITGYFKNELDDGLLDFYSNRKENELGPSIFWGPNLTQQQLSDALGYLAKVVQTKYPKALITHQQWIPRFGTDGEVAQKDGVMSSVFIKQTSYDQIKAEANVLRYPLLKTGFKSVEHTYRKTHKVTSYINYSDELLLYPSVIEGINSMDWIRMSNSMSYKEHRISNGGIIKYCRGDESDAHFVIPESSKYLRVFFEKHQLKFSIPAHGELTKQIFKNIGGIYGIGRFSSVGAIKVLEELENENVLHVETLVGLIKQHKPNGFAERPFDFMSVLLENNIVELGAQIQCTICHQWAFYPLNELSPQIICKNCRSSFRPPQNHPKETFKWSYRGVGPFSRNNKIDGLFCGFLALSLFERGIYVVNDGITSFMNFQLEKLGRVIEVDLMVQLRKESFSENRTDLIFCECKTYKDFSQTDIDRMILLGEAFPNSILVLCTLKNQLTEVEKVLVSSLVNHFRKGHGNRPLNPILVLTSNELLPKTFHNAFDHFGEIHTVIRYNDLLGYLCEKSCEIYLGLRKWSDIKMDEWRTYHSKRNLIGGIVQSLLSR